MKAKKEKASKEVRDLKRTIATVAMAAIKAGATVEGVLKAVKRAFPEAKTGKNSVLWYRSEMRRRGEKVPALAPATKEKAAKVAAARARVARV